MKKFNKGEQIWYWTHGGFLCVDEVYTYKEHKIVTKNGHLLDASDCFSTSCDARAWMQKQLWELLNE